MGAEVAGTELTMMSTSINRDFRKNIKKGKLSPILLEISVMCLIALTIYLPRWVKLNRVVTPDEDRWLERSGNFNLALYQGNYARTYQKEHPGVTLMWVGAVAYDRLFQEYQDNHPEYRDRITKSYFNKGIAWQNPLAMLVESRKILAILNTIILLLAYWFVRRMIGVGPALIGFALIAFDPFHLALTRLMHLDGLLANFYLLSLLAYINFTEERKPFAMIISGMSAGLAWLTKSPGFILIPTLGLVVLLQIWKKMRIDSRTSRLKIIWGEAWPLAVWGSLGVFVFVAAWPAMWMIPLKVLSKVFGIAQIYASEGHSSRIFFNGQIVESEDFGLRYFYFYPLTYLWRVTPIVMIGLTAFILGTLRKLKPLADSKVHWLSTVLLIAICIFMVVMTFGLKKFDRYIIPVYAPFDILAGLGWYASILWLKEKLPSRLKMASIPLAIGFIFILQAISSLRIFPNMLAYYNPIMGGSRKAPDVMQIGWGEGLDLAALYLNQKTNAENLVVSSWYGQGSFPFFFNGETIHIESKILAGNNWENINSSDYIITYIHQWQRNLPEDLLAELATQKPEHTIWINGIEYVRIYKQE
jgi:hypothetical protein